MDCIVDSTDLSNLVLKIQKMLGDLSVKGITDHRDTNENLSDALRGLSTVLDGLSANVATKPSDKCSAHTQRAFLLDEKSAEKQSTEDEPAENLSATQNKVERCSAAGKYIPLMLAQISADLHYLFVSQSYADWLGLSSSEIVGRHISEVMSEESYQESLPHIRRVLSGEEVFATITISTCGQQTCKEIALIPQFDKSGAVAICYAIVKDGSDCRQNHSQAEKEARKSMMVLEHKVDIRTMELKVENAALERSRDYLDMIINSISDPIFVLDRDHRLIFVNDAFCRFFGRPNEEIIGKTAYDLSFSKEMAETFWKMDDEVFNKTTESVFEETIISDSGRPKIVLTKLSPFTDEDGNRLIVAIARDITDIKKAEDQIRLQANLLDQVHNTVIAIDLDGNITYWNKFAEDLLQWTAEEVLGRNIADTVVPEGKLDQMRSVISDLFRNRGSRDGEFALRKKDGSIVPSYQCFATIKDNREAPIGFIGVAWDIAERKKAEEALIIAKTDAEAAARAKSEFLANMSHEIRTPLNAIIGMTSLLLEEPLTPEQKDYIELIETNGDALLVIINDILDFARMESNRTVLEEYEFDFFQCIEESLDLVAVNATKKGINLAYTIDKNVPERIIGDPGKLRQVLGNLLSNAVKFTDKGEVVVSVTSQNINKANEIHFSVKDTGIGISEECMKNLFQPFCQMEPSTSRLYGGTGLGLAISRKIVEMMNGQIWAESREGIGSDFHFTIIAPSVSAQPSSMEALRQLKERRVLILVDNQTNRRFLVKQLCDWDMIPVIAASGQEALTHIQHEDEPDLKLDIAILDTDLQDMSGPELADKIKKCEKSLPMVLLTSMGTQAPPGCACLLKPIKPTHLRRLLADILSKRSPVRAKDASFASRGSTQTSPLKILLAEDNISSQKVAQQMLKRLGYRADIVCNGLEVLEALERENFDIVLMDMRMPGMDGLEATRIIRQRWADGGPKIIAVTAHALPGDREKCLDAGMDGYITKPIRKEDLARELKKYGSWSAQPEVSRADPSNKV